MLGGGKFQILIEVPIVLFRDIPGGDADYQSTSWPTFLWS